MDRDRSGRLRKVYLARHNPYRKWSERKFIRKYRLSKRRVKKITTDFAAWSTRTQGTPVGGGLSHMEQVCLALRFFATGASFPCIAETQQVSEATVSRCVEDVSNFFYQNSANYIQWPDTGAKKGQKAWRFYKRHHRRPFTFGCIDGTHVHIVSPSSNGFEGAHPPEGVFVNRRGFHSINAMVVCDADLRFTHVDASFAGSANDQYSFSSSQLYDDAEAGEWGNFFLLGDSGCIDGSGGYLHLNPAKACRVITTCACLHNLAVEDRTPHHDAEDDGRDRFRPRREAARGPIDFNQDVPEPPANDHRDEYVNLNFQRRRRGPHDNTSSEEESEVTEDEVELHTEESEQSGQSEEDL